MSSGGVAAGLVGEEPPSPTGRGAATTPVAAGDAWRLYQLTRTCDREGCADHFAVSADRGRTWSLRGVPGPADTQQWTILAAANTTVVLAATGGTAAQPRTTRWVTTDAGQTWTAARPGPARPITTWDRIAFVGAAVVAVTPGTGRLTTAPQPAPLRAPRPFDGGAGWWLVGTADSGLSTASGVLGSTDQGRTFHGPGFADVGMLSFDTSMDGLYVASTSSTRPRTWGSKNGRDWSETPG